MWNPPEEWINTTRRGIHGESGECPFARLRYNCHTFSHRSAAPSSPLDGVMEVRGVKAQWHSASPFHPQPLIHHDKCAQMIWPSSTNGERRVRTSFAQDPLQLIHPALLWANWSGALPVCVLLIYPTQFNGSCSQGSYFFWMGCFSVCVCRFSQRGVWGFKNLSPWSPA